MTAREMRGPLTVDTILEACDDMPDFVFEQIQDIIDNPEMDIPDEAATPGNVKLLQHLQSYYANQYPYLIGLWGVMRYNAARDLPHRNSMRDYLEKAASACRVKYEGASRMLTGYQTIMEETKGVRTL